MTRYPFVILLIVFFASCEKSNFMGEPGEPIFTASIPFTQSDSLDIVAGDALYYMYASHFESNEEKILKGLFGKEENCLDGCSENFSIQFHQKLTQLSDLSVGNYSYYSVPRDGYKHSYNLITNDNNPIENASWRIGDNIVSGESISVNSDNQLETGDAVRLIYRIPDVITVQFERSILPMSVDCDIFLELRKLETGLEVEVVTSSPFSQVSWSDGTLGSKKLITTNGTTLSARVFAGSGCTTDISFFISSIDIAQNYQVGFNQESISFATPENVDNAVTISYTDDEGDFFTSSLVGQIIPFSFEILSIESYETNELGDPTLIIDAEFECLLFGDSGKTKRIENGHSTFAVSY